MFAAFDSASTAPAVPGTVAVLPLGATEAHGPHLPLETDTLIAEGILDCAAAAGSAGTPIWRLPPLTVGASSEHADRPGTKSIEPEALIAQIVGIGARLAARDVRRVVLFNAHGGNVAAASIAALKLRTSFNMLAASAHWLDFGLPVNLAPPAPVAADVHGGWIETSVLLHLLPDRVFKNAPAHIATPPAPSLYPSGPIAWGWMTSDMAEHGYIGHPELAAAALGRALVEHAAHRLNKLLQELAAAKWPR